MTNASDLLYQYSQAEAAIEAAEKTMEDAKAEKLALFGEVLNNKELMSVLTGPGVICNSRIMTIDGPNSAVIEMRPMPLYSHELDEVSGDV